MALLVAVAEGSGINSVLVDILSSEDPAALLSHSLEFKGSKCIFPVRKRHPPCYGKSLSPLLLEAGGHSINDRPAPGILPHEPPHGTCRIQDSARSPSLSGLADLVNFPRRLAFIHRCRSLASCPRARPSPQSGRDESWRTPARGVLPSFLKTTKGRPVCFCVFSRSRLADSVVFD